MGQQISFSVGTVVDKKEVIVCFKGFDSNDEAEAYAQWLGENLGLLLDESVSSTVH